MSISFFQHYYEYIILYSTVHGASFSDVQDFYNIPPEVVYSRLSFFNIFSVALLLS